VKMREVRLRLFRSRRQMADWRCQETGLKITFAYVTRSGAGQGGAERNPISPSSKLGWVTAAKSRPRKLIFVNGGAECTPILFAV
jgi:hypothetical protein